MTALDPPDERNIHAGMRTAVELLDATRRDDLDAYSTALAACDPATTIIALTTAWASVVDLLGGDQDTLIEVLRKQVPDGN
ncbi:hypothetical protein [Nocardia fluminea]|uniref:hypothetical protein n=1 Tax=Nocardia fluminea TaxID=134984 RepID=UPI00364A2062